MTRRWTIVPVLLIALAPPLRAQTTALDEGVTFIRNGQFDQALVKLNEAHRIAPRNATIENLLGITETQLGHLNEANEHYRSAVRLDAGMAAAHRNLGFNLFTAKDYAAAEPELRTAARFDPKDHFAHYYLLLLFLATARDAEAVEQAPQSGDLVENDPEVAAQLATAEIRTGHIDAAATRVQRLEASSHLSPIQEYRFGTLFAQHASYTSAVHCFRQIVAVNPSWQNRYNLALALLYSDQAEEASTLLSTLHAEQPTNADIATFLGSAFEMQQKMPQALEAYRAAVAADPSNPDRTLDYTRLLMDTDRYDEAIQVVQSGMGETAATAPLQVRLGAIEMVKSNYDAARDAFHAALAADPKLDVAYVGLAQTYAREANDAEAIRILESARTQIPGSYLLQYYFGLLASRLGRENEALTALEAATRLDPRSPDPFFELGKLYETQEKWPRARQALEHVIELNPKFAAAHYQLSRVYNHLGMTSQAAQQATQTHVLIDTQRTEALERQRARGGSFQPQADATP